MAAAAVAGLIPVLHSVAGDKSRYYIGRQLWFGFIAVYGVVVYVVRMPWVPIHEDFWCHGNITNTCLIECFEKSFNSPVVGIWYFFFFIFLALFFLMEFFMAQIRHKQIKAKSVESAAGEMEEGSMVGIQENAPSPKKSILNFHQEKTLLLLYLLYFLLQQIRTRLSLAGFEEAFMARNCKWLLRAESGTQLTASRKWGHTTAKELNSSHNLKEL
ncbi:uncharacterized protein LOC102899890 isoform X2 [Felis catus]|uniref:Connexin N-terminal domain-containing protein n=1 Tax=Felis catus TaxID=9685 RepID=A0ABI8A1P4_FELCA|nr:uncharacterized protein LOC102899890 isoform X2 [Felis catus]